MVISCSAYGCKHRFVKGGNLKYHKFPSDLQGRKKWIIALKMDKFEPSKYAVICSAHFTEGDYETNVHGNKVLRKGAVPTQFSFPEHYISKANTETFNLGSECPDNKVVVAPILQASGNHSSTGKRQHGREPHYVGDFREDSENPVKQRKFTITSQTLSKSLNQNVTHMQTNMKRMKSKRKATPRRLIVGKANTGTSVDVRGSEFPSESNINNETHLMSGAECSNNKVVATPVLRDIENSSSTGKRRQRTQPHYFGDFREKDLENPVNRKKFWIASQTLVTSLKANVKSMQTKTRRMKHKIETLKNLVGHLVNENRISRDCSSLLHVHT